MPFADMQPHRVESRSWARRLLFLLIDRREERPHFSLIVTALFCLALAWVHAHHEFWRDEMHAWNVARTATGLWDLLVGSRRYDGHPFLWYYLLHLLSRLSRSEVCLHVAAVALATASTYAWLRESHMPRLLRLMLLPTYLYFFEYGVISRGYSLGIFLVFAFCYLFSRRGLRIVPLVILLVLLSFTSAYGALIAVALVAFVTWQSIAELSNPALDANGKRTLAVQCLVGVALLALAVWGHAKTSMPPADALFYDASLGHGQRLLSPLGPLRFFWSGLVPWNSHEDGNWIVSGFLGEHYLASRHVLPSVAGFLFLVCTIAMLRAPAVALTFVLGCVGMAAFQAEQYAGYLRHWGHFFVLLIVCCWLCARRAGQRPWLLYAVVGMLMGVQGITGVRAAHTDIVLPFSGAREAASYLREQGLAASPILASLDLAGSGVAGFLDRRVYYPESGIEAGQERLAVVFDGHRNASPLPLVALGFARHLSQRLREPVLMVLNHELVHVAADGGQVELLHVTKPSVITDETFWIYRVPDRRRNPARAMP
jgi:hypothetical protein